MEAPPKPHRTSTSTSSNAIAAAKREEDDEVKPYVIVAEIGKGSFATVYKGYHEVSAPLAFSRYVRNPSSRIPTSKLR